MSYAVPRLRNWVWQLVRQQEIDARRLGERKPAVRLDALLEELERVAHDAWRPDEITVISEEARGAAVPQIGRAHV